MHLIEAVRRLGGVVHRSTLHQLGFRDAAIRRSLRRTDLIGVRRGWYALPVADAATVMAVRVGGQLSCATRLRQLGVWVSTPPGEVHVAVASNASRLGRRRRTDGAIVHWRGRPGAVRQPVDGIADSLRLYVRCAGAAQGVASIDSALHQQLTDVDALLAAGIPEHVLDLVDSRAESGGESLLRLRLHRLRLKFTIQHEVPGVGRVDFLVGDSLVIEVDGFEFHGDRSAFEADRRRDRELLARGYVVMRITYRQLADEWDRIERCILAVHRSRRDRQAVLPHRVVA